MMNTTQFHRALLASTVLATLVAACSKKPAGEQSSAGTVDTATLHTSAVTQAVGPGVHVTRTDAKSVSRATGFELTPQNFTAFLAVADSLVALEGRDAGMQTYLTANLDDAGSTDVDAGLKYLESNAAVSNAISSAGMSARDYFVEAIAIADASQFMNDPKAAPPTPALSKNAEFLRQHTSDLARLRAQQDNKPAAVVTP
jgi:hypothetical protein